MEKHSLVVEIDVHELATRLIERGCHMKRPKGKTGQDAFKEFRLDADAGNIPAYIVDDFEAMAHIAIAYFGECFNSGKRPN
jgi:hypothetical protein